MRVDALLCSFSQIEKKNFWNAENINNQSPKLCCVWVVVRLLFLSLCQSDQSERQERVVLLIEINGIISSTEI